MVDKYYKKYYVESDVVQEEYQTIVLDPYDTMIKRKCSCHIGHIDEKTGKLVAPPPIEISKHRKEKTIQVPKR